MGLDATKPAVTAPLEFERLHVKGIETVDLAAVLQQDPQAALSRIVVD